MHIYYYDFDIEIDIDRVIDLDYRLQLDDPAQAFFNYLFGIEGILKKSDWAPVISITEALRRDREERFRYELLDSRDVKIGDLDSVISGEITQNYLAALKRAGVFTMQETGEINYLSDRIKPVWQLRVDDIWHEFPMGVFLLSTPGRKVGRTVLREITGYGKLLILHEDIIDAPLYIAAGTVVTEAVRSIIYSAGISKINIQASDAILSSEREWGIGASKLNIINELLKAINYESLSDDPNGYLVSKPYLNPAVAPIAWIFRDDEEGLYLPDLAEEIDFFSAPNKIICIVSEPDMPPLVAVRTNENASSPLSYQSRGRWITRLEQVYTADQESLEGLADRLLFEASQVVSAIPMKCALLPLEAGEVVKFENRQLSISARYVLHSFTVPLRAGGLMDARLRRVVTI